MTITKKQKQIVLNILKWMQKTNTELTVEEPIDKPEILQKDIDDEFCEFGADFIFYVNNPKKTFTFLENNGMLKKEIEYLKSHKQNICDLMKRDKKIDEKFGDSPKWEWPQPCDYMIDDIQMDLESVLEDPDPGEYPEDMLDDMGIVYSSEVVGNTEV